MFVQISSHAKSKIRQSANPSNDAPMIIVINVGKDKTRWRSVVTFGIPGSALMPG